MSLITNLPTRTEEWIGFYLSLLVHTTSSEQMRRRRWRRSTKPRTRRHLSMWLLHAHALRLSFHQPRPAAIPSRLADDSKTSDSSNYRLVVTRPTPATGALKQCRKLTRRELAIGTSSLQLLLSTHFLSGLAQAADDEGISTVGTEKDNSPSIQEVTTVGTEKDNTPSTQEVTTAGTEKDKVPSTQEVTTTGAEDNDAAPNRGEAFTTDRNRCGDSKTITKQAFIDVSVDGEAVGRVVIGLYGADAPIGSTRFASLLSGAAGVSYRRKEFVRIMPNYVQHGGVRSYGVDAELARRTGTDLIADALLSEWGTESKNCTGTRNTAGSVGIVVRDPSKAQPKLKLVARKGKLEIDEEQVGTDPNGTEFVIATRDSPDLDGSALVVGRVLSGMDVVEKISKVKTVQENTSSPYFRVAKLIGDKRAVVAERGFNRPYSKVVITGCGLLD